MLGMSDLSCVFSSKVHVGTKLNETTLMKLRLGAIAALFESQIVEHVLELSLRASARGLKVKFRGNANTDFGDRPTNLSFEGEYLSDKA